MDFISFFCSVCAKSRKLWFFLSIHENWKMWWGSFLCPCLENQRDLMYRSNDLLWLVYLFFLWKNVFSLDMWINFIRISFLNFFKKISIRIYNWMLAKGIMNSYAVIRIYIGERKCDLNSFFPLSPGRYGHCWSIILNEF